MNAKPAAGLMTALATDGADVPLEELRFGVVLNGGVSLAVWMGGSMVELDRLTKATADRQTTSSESHHASAYRTMLRLAGCTARADVIAGTSAGGINGAALAIAQARPRADLQMLRDVWMDHGSIDALLRRPFRGAPTSLLSGDDGMLKHLRTTFADLADAPGSESPDPANAPVDLTMTATLLSGVQQITVDSMGQRLPQDTHAGLLRWQRRPATPAQQDPFATEHLADTTEELALAARATASFPVAFEPTFLGIGRQHPNENAPDMSDASGWSEPGQDRSRYVVDGGVLTNMPTQAAVDAINAMPASTPVRRVMLLVYPNAPKPRPDTPDHPDDPPSVIDVVAGVANAISTVANRTFVDELAEHNVAAAARRNARADVVRSVTDAADVAGHARLRDLAANVVPHWQKRLALHGVDAPAVMKVPDEADGIPSVWPWGLAGAVGVAEGANDLLRRLVWVAPGTEGYAQISAARSVVSAALTDLHAMAGAHPEDAKAHAQHLTQRVAETAAAVSAALPAFISCRSRTVDQPGPHRDLLAGWVSLFESAGERASPDAIAIRLLHLEMVCTTFADFTPSATLPMEVAQLSAQVPNAFADETTTIDDKLGGKLFGRFGGFLNDAWRVNDWIWGRFDAATVLAKIVLDPARVRRTASLVGKLQRDHDAAVTLATDTFDEICHELFGGAAPSSISAELTTAAIAELTNALNGNVGDEDLPPSMPALATVFAWALHMDAVVRELPALEQAVANDDAAGAGRQARGHRMVNAHPEVFAAAKAAEPDALPDWELAATALTAFDQAGIGREHPIDVLRTNRALRTVSSAAAVAITVADTAAISPGWLRAVVRAARFAARVPYALVQGLAHRRVWVRAATWLGSLGGGLGLITFAVAGGQPWWINVPAGLAGSAGLFAAGAYSLLRSARR